MQAPELGNPRLHLRSCDSTNERARLLAMSGAPHGTIITATEQTVGRGRQGRVWSAPPNSALLCSLVLRHPPRLLSLIAGVATCDVVGNDARLKWPNDVLLGAGKVAGILVEGRPQDGWAVLGIGINIAVKIDELPPDVRGRAASMGLPPDSIEHTLRDLIAALERRLGQSAEVVLEAWRSRDALVGREISWSQGSGRADGIDERGGLIVALEDGARITLDAGEVHLTVG